MGLRGKARLFVRALRGDEESRYVFAERLATVIHPDAILSDRSRYWLHDHEFRELYDRFQPDHRRRLDRVWLLRQFAIRAAGIDGDTAECGVYGGLSSFVIAQVQPSKPHHAFDSFAGLSAPSAVDGAYWSAGDLRAPLDVVSANLAGLQNVNLYEGWIPDRFPEVAARRFSLVHIDVDLAEPTEASLRFFGDRMVRDGVIVLDDYGFETCPGARAVTDQFAAERGIRVIEAPTGQGLILDAASAAA